MVESWALFRSWWHSTMMDADAHSLSFGMVMAPQ